MGESSRSPTNRFEAHGSPIAFQGNADSVIINNRQPDDPFLKLPRVPAALFNHQDEADSPVCHENTRTVVLQEIYDWFEHDNKKPVFWLKGWAGTGKSTIARTVARRYHENKTLGASFFFSRFKEGCAKAEKFVTSIAYQLGKRSPSVRKSICATLRDNEDVLDVLLSDQWQDLVLGPVSMLDKTEEVQRYLVVIDALDECDEKCKALVELLFKTDSPRLRLFVTSRPGLPVSLESWKDPFPSIILHHVNPKTVDEDIFKFLHHSLGRDRDGEWPGALRLKRLVQQAGGLFIWAATASRFLTDSPEVAESRLRELLGDEELNSESDMDLSDSESSSEPDRRLKPEKSLDLIYLAVLDAAISGALKEKEKRICEDLMKTYLGSIVVLFAQLAPHTLYTLIEINTKKHNGNHAHEILRKLGAILDIPRSMDEKRTVIRLHHPSLRDFLLNSSRCNRRFYICAEQAHRTVFNGCLRLLNKVLRQDIYDLNDFSASVQGGHQRRIEQAIPPAVQYGCLYWTKHLQAIAWTDYDCDNVYEFLKDHALHWLEALSWMGKYHDGLEALASLNIFLMNRATSQLSRLVTDLIRFGRCHGPIIKQAPLQLYLGSLIFSPQDSLIREMNERIILQYLEYLPETKPSWGLHLHSLEYHQYPIHRLAFSDERQILASASTDGNLRLWDIMTGRCLGAIENSKQKIDAISFSPCGQWLAALSDGTLCVWDVSTELSKYRLKDEESGAFKAMAFSEDGQIVTVSQSYQVQYWDVTTRECMRSIKGPIGQPDSVIFSDDTRTLATWSFTSLVHLWKLTANGCYKKAILDSTMNSHAVALSPDGTVVAAASTNIRILDTDTGHCLQVIECQLPRMEGALAVSKDKQMVASISNVDTSVKLWSLLTGQCLCTLEGHRLRVRVVSFLGNSKVLASGSFDLTIRLWDMSAVQDMRMKAERDKAISVTALAAEDGANAILAAIGYSNSSIQLYNLRSHQQYMTLTGHGDRIAELVFLADGVTLASTSADCTLRLWNTASGQCLHVFRASASVVRLVTAHEGTILAPLSISTSIQVWDVWDVTTIRCLHKLTGHAGPIEAAVFSKDDMILASASSDRTIRLWNLGDGTCLKIFMGHKHRVMALEFAEDGRMLASATFEKTVWLWDVKTGSCLQKFSHVYHVTNVAISANNSTLACMSLATLSIWDIQSAKCVQVLDSGFSQYVHLSSTGRYLETANGSLMLMARNTDLEDATDQPASAIHVGRRWVMYRGKKVLWLPTEFRSPRHMAIRGNTAILVYVSGQIMILRFK